MLTPCHQLHPPVCNCLLQVLFKDIKVLVYYKFMVFVLPEKHSGTKGSIYQCGSHIFGQIAKAIPAYGLMMSVCLSICHPHLVYLAFKFWNLLCNPAIPSSAVSCL